MQNRTHLINLGSIHFEFSGKKTCRVSNNIHGIKKEADLELAPNLDRGLNDLLKNLEDVNVRVGS